MILQKDGSILIEVDSDEAAKWFTNEINRVAFCVSLAMGSDSRVGSSMY